MADEFIEGDEPRHDVFDPLDQKHAAKEAEDRRKNLETDRRASLERRQLAYIRLFKGAPMGDDIQVVRDDLKKFCRGDMSTYHDNERLHVLMTGRQEVWLRIQEHLELPFDKLYEQYTGD